MIVTLTANPSLDRAVALAAPLAVGEVQSVVAAREDAGGKGLNVSRVIAAAGGSTLAVLPLDPADPFATAVHQTGLPVRAVPVRGAARTNLTVTDPAGTTTKLNALGTARTEADATALREATVAACADADWLVLAGSLPPGLPDDFYVTVIRAVRERWGTRAPSIAVDTSGAALQAVVADGRPDLIKPNDEELAALTGTPLDVTVDGVDRVREVAATLVPHRVGAAFVTLGSAGALLITADGAWHGTPPPIRVRSTVGAGDSSLAGFLLARTAGAAPADAVRGGIRYGAAAASLPGTQPPAPADLPTGDVPVVTLT
ncbi:1-phosphofructokinase family hexose kinase [Microbacterium telephonicum]|uniref:1-phosphofructokinase n=1 Tax=Microbacterium telephonicum TaxID=1714841 RepID=A0A498C1A7_9MICO|nr:1-phosphofructokinase family hexose kinase [Microbacterium telephonicum]RLK49385.1 1-phosphofructokinase [Microbacterium telephonicum]